jgi:hypothetical protein
MAISLVNLLVKLGLDAGEFSKGLDDAEGKADSASKKITAGLSAIGGAAVVGGLAAAGAGLAAVGIYTKGAVEAAMEAEVVEAQLNSVLQATGGIAGVTAEQAKGLADAFGKTTMFEDDLILSGENMLLTFTNIGEDVFPLATQTMLDMSQALGQDLKSSAMQIGKAINNPIEGISALTRVGVTFTKEQEDQIRAMQEAGDMAGAQGVILGELQREFGGAAEAAGGTFAGKMEILQNRLGNVQETLGAALIPLLLILMTALTPLIEGFAQFVTQISEWIAANEPLKEFLASLPLLLQSGFGWLMENEGVIVGILAAIGVAIATFVYTTVLPAIASVVVAAAPVIAVLAAVGIAAYLLYQAWKNNFGGIRDTVGPIVATLVEWLQVNIPLAIATLSAFWTDTLWPAIQDVWAWMNSTLFPFLLALADFITAVLGVAITAYSGLWQNVLAPAMADALVVIQDVAGWLGEKLSPAFDWLSQAIEDATGWFSDLAATMRGLQLPSWLTPGSPTPLETGLVGINQALHRITSSSLPTFSAGLKLEPLGLPQLSASLNGPDEGEGGEMDGYDFSRLESKLDRLPLAIRDAMLQVPA